MAFNGTVNGNAPPGSAAADRAQQPQQAATSWLWTPHLGWYVGGGAALLALLAGAVVWVRSRQRAGAAV